MTIQTKSGKKKITPVFHPILIGLYPVLALLGYNIIQLDPIYAIRAIVATLLVSALVFALTLLITRERYKAGLLASLTLMLFLTYGHVYHLLENKSYFGHHRFMIVIWLGLFILGTYTIFHLKKKPRTVTTFLNYFSIVLIAIPLFQIVYFEATHAKTNLKPAANPEVDSVWQPTTAAPAGSPDVYFIVMDAYSRSDILKNNWGYDNSEFLKQLQELGFYVVDCSKSNYSFTAASVSSTLNMDYMDKFAPNIVKDNQSLYDLGEYLKHNKVRDLFSTLGYDFVTFDTDIWWLDITDSDQFISQYSSPWQRLLDFKLLDNFETYYLNTTAMRIFEEFTNSQQNRIGKAFSSSEIAHYNRIKFSFDQLSELPQETQPKFVYAHFVAPHYPFVFNPDGSYKYTVSNSPGYINEVKYMNKRMLEVLGQLIKDSKTPPVIVLESDHGLSFDNRNANFMAYYMPNSDYKDFYSTLTPINSFRLVFNNYFGANYPMLEDVARYASYQSPNEYEIVDYPCTAN